MSTWLASFSLVLELYVTATAPTRRRAELGSLIDRRQKTRAVHRRAVAEVVVRHRDVGRQIVALAPQSVDHPRTDTGMAQQLRSGMHHDHRRAMNEQLVMERAYDGQFVSDRRRSR